MNIGSIVLANNRGLGLLAKEFYDHGLIKTLVVYENRKYKSFHEEWFKKEDYSLEKHIRPEVIVNKFKKCDAVLLFETPMNWGVVPEIQKRLGIPVILMPMHECTPKKLPCKPDFFLCASPLDLKYFPERSKYLPIPIPDFIEWKEKTEAKVFIHNAGYQGLSGRNSTREVLEAMEFVEHEDLQLIIRTQKPVEDITNGDPRVKIIHKDCTYEELYSEGDVFLAPRKHSGLALPLQEAFASGYAVMAGDRYPVNEYLPKELLIPVLRYERVELQRGFMEIDRALYSARVIAQKMNEWYNQDITELSHRGRLYREENSWDNLKPKYIDLFEDLI